MKPSTFFALTLGVLVLVAGIRLYRDRALDGSSFQAPLQAGTQVRVIQSEPLPTPTPPQPDPQWQAIVDDYLERLQAAGFDPQQQGIWLESGNGKFAGYQGQTPLPAASLTKVITSLAALDRWEPQHQFYTRVMTQGTVTDGVLAGDLIIQGGGDPFYVWESGILLGNQLNKMGIQTVTGRLIIQGIFVMNFERDRYTAGTFLREALHADRWTWETQQQYEQNLPADTPQPRVDIQGEVVVATESIPNSRLLITQPSLPLVQLLKQMNNYSNNIMADLLADLLGGPAQLKTVAQTKAGVPPDQVNLINGSGLGHENQISPQGNCQVITAIADQLAPYGLGIPDILPISHVDPGTLENRHLPFGVAAKTGTLWDVSTLSGLLAASDQPVDRLDNQSLCFAIMHRGANIGFFYTAQENLLSQLKNQIQGQTQPQ